MNEKPAKGIIESVFECTFVSIPCWAAKQCDYRIRNSASVRLKAFTYSGIGVSSVLAFFLCMALSSYLKRSGVHSGFEVIAYGSGFYALYNVTALPFFMIFSRAVKSESGGAEVKRKRQRGISPEEIEKGKAGTKMDEAYIGTSLWSGRHFYISDEMRLMHTHVVGSTGVGKTESVLLPLLKRDIERKSGAIILDAKGDLELLAKIRCLVETNGRGEDFLFFSLSHPEISDTYNPLLRGNASEIKDKLIGSTEWREEFYRKKAEEAALTLLRPLHELGTKATFKELYELLTEKSKLTQLIERTDDPRMKKDLETMKELYHENTKFLSGFIADLGLVTKSEFSRLTDTPESRIDLLQVYEQKKIVYFALNTQGYEETAKRFGRLILQDIKTVSNHIQTQMENDDRHFFPVYVDEFSSFAYENFIEFLNKARGAKIAVTLIHQSLADLAQKRTTFQQQILENTNIKIVMRQDDPYSIDKYSKMGGSKRTVISTYQTADNLLGTGLTGRGSIREGQAFRIDPDLVRSLGRGEAIVVTKFPQFKIDYLKLPMDRSMNLEWIHMKIKREREESTQKQNELKLKTRDTPEDGRFQTLSHMGRKFEERRENIKKSS